MQINQEHVHRLFIYIVYVLADHKNVKFPFQVNTTESFFPVSVYV